MSKHVYVYDSRLIWNDMTQRNKLKHEKKRRKLSWSVAIHKTMSKAPSQKSHLLLISTFFFSLAPTIVECSVIPAYFAQITY